MTYVDLHCHTEYSAMDGLSTCKEAAQRAADNGSPALAITDHGTCAGHPAHQAACLDAGIAPIFGLEAYFVPDRHAKTGRASNHMILLATDDQALRDLWALSTESYASGYYWKPRVDWELLERYGSRLIATTGCLSGIVAKPKVHGSSWMEPLKRMHSLLGGRLYLELQPNQLAPQITLNRLLVQIHDATGIPMVVSTDAHYTDASQERLHKLWLACQTGTGNDDYWNYIHMFSEHEVRQGLARQGLDAKHIEAAIRSTTEIASQCTARISGQTTPPVFTPGGTHADDSQRLLDLCVANWHKVPDTREYRERLAREWKLVQSKQLAGCYLMVEDVISWTRAQGRLVGPGRGSAAGSLMSYLLGITTMDPIPNHLLFERFLTEGRMALPDFDMDFASSWRTPVTDYVTRKYGADHVVRVGTTGRYRSRSILEKLFGVMKDELAPEWFSDQKMCSAIIDEAEAGTAGLGVPWDEVIEHPDLQDLSTKYNRVFEAAGQLVGRVRTYGQHPAGLVISTDADLLQSLPMRVHSEDKGLLISQYDYRAVEALGLLKLDFLTLRTLDTLQHAIDLVRARTGTEIRPDTWTTEHQDPQVWEDLGTGNTLGCFQVESALGQQACRQMKPVSLSELADLNAYVRPGPRNNGLDRAYLRRRAGTEEITYPHPLLEEELSATQGVMLYQENILTACRVIAGYDSGEADGVRKILGKKQTGKIKAAGEEFIRRAVERGHDEVQVTELWNQMAEFGRYGFNRAHAYAYATLAYWTAWMKTHYPVEMLTGILSTVPQDRHARFAQEARRLGVQVLPPDVRFCGANFQPEGLGIRYGLSSIKGFGPAKIAKVVAGRVRVPEDGVPRTYDSLQDFLSRSQVDAGALYALARAGALDALVPTRRGLIHVLERARSGDATRCIYKDEDVRSHGLPCTFDWDAEMAGPVPVQIGKRPPAVKPPPRRCTRACRHYTPPAAVDPATVAEFTPAELFTLDNEVYGTWMNEAVFAQLGNEELRTQGRRFARLALTGPARQVYPMLAVWAGYHDAVTSTGNAYMWANLVTEVSALRAVVFQPRGDEPDLFPVVRSTKQGTLISAMVYKDRYYRNGWRTSWRLSAMTPLGG